MVDRLRDRVEYGVDAGVARIELARPGAANALDHAMGLALREAADAARLAVERAEARVVVLAAQGRVFSVGGDLGEFTRASDRGAQVRATAGELHAALATLTSLSVPVVSVVHGTAAGGGLGVALAGDIVLAAAHAKLVFAYTASGLTPDCGLTWLVPRRISWPRAMDLALLNRPLTGEAAAAWGLVSRAVPAAELADLVDQVVSTLASGAVGALSATKRLMAGSSARGRVDAMDLEAATVGDAMGRPEAIEGVDAFLAKRRPVYHP